MYLDNTPSAIGVYDSGVGGLSVLRAIRRALPHESFVYVADSLHAPYGSQPPHVLRARAHEIVGFFMRRRAKALVLACNTVSVAAAEAVRASFDLPIVAMEPAIKPATQITRSGTVLVLATVNTIKSQAVERLCKRFGTDARIVLQACPGLAEQVERGQLSSAATRELLITYLRPGLSAGADTIVLGCTHYAFLLPQISALAGPDVSVIEPSEAVARQLQVRLAPSRSPIGNAPGSTLYFTSGSIEPLRAFLDMIGEPGAPVRSMADD